MEKKLYLTFLLKDLFAKEKLSNVYNEELSNILKSISASEIPEDYEDLVAKNLKQNFYEEKKIKFENDIFHRSKILKHFFEDEVKVNRTQKDFKSVY